MMQSRFVKTPLNRRKFYTYYFLDGTTRVFHVGDNGVTAEIIKKLHSYDDAEVYNNIKNVAHDAADSDIRTESVAVKGCTNLGAHVAVLNVEITL